MNEMSKKTETYRKFIFIGIIIIALGITFTTTFKDTVGSLGIVLIAVGGLFFIIGMSKKRKEDEQKNK
jgi:Sec-independent protein secretion pathway component TatC